MGLLAINIEATSTNSADNLHTNCIHQTPIAQTTGTNMTDNVHQ